jgi:hypothetical protein
MIPLIIMIDFSNDVLVLDSLRELDDYKSCFKCKILRSFLSCNSLLFINIVSFIILIRRA